ncbi:tyrosine-type recombinase/integrase [Enterocloster bolteae]|uniref:tyrosine-type recombinase/integrase n=1 Tax=Enterocloster bolteae TaxID=208479 RepID=UPI002A831346|nr:tyrosine-type recombinase/integrase [Enterocloster bolteae]
MNYLSEDSLKNLLTRPDQTTIYGRRDAALLCVLYDTGARVQELIDLSVRDVRLDEPSVIRLTGKGRKTRTVPILHPTAAILKSYMERHGLNPQRDPDQALFCNHQGNRLTRPGVTYILKKYANELQADGNLSNESVTPHVMRHTKAMHLLRANVDLHYIRDFLGHIDITTTEVYAKADAEMKRAAFEKADIGITTNEMTSWQKNDDLLSWLTSLGQK